MEVSGNHGNLETWRIADPGETKNYFPVTFQPDGVGHLRARVTHRVAAAAVLSH
jgi:hypothetical protein